MQLHMENAIALLKSVPFVGILIYYCISFSKYNRILKCNCGFKMQLHIRNAIAFSKTQLHFQKCNWECNCISNCILNCINNCISKCNYLCNQKCNCILNCIFKSAIGNAIAIQNAIAFSIALFIFSTKLATYTWNSMKFTHKWKNWTKFWRILISFNIPQIYMTFIWCVSH